jgi:oxaloacetate decarboxylase beta subunit
MDKLLKLWQSTGLYHVEPGQLFMMAVCILLIYLAIKKGFEPLLLLPIGFGGLLGNIPVANMAEGRASCT